MSGTDDGTILIDDSLMATFINGSGMTVPASTSAGSYIIQNINYDYNGDETRFINISGYKTTPGGKGVISLVLQRI